MATGKKYYWIKLKKEFMTGDVIDFLMAQPGGAEYVVLYQMLIMTTINSHGRLVSCVGEIIIPYDVPKIQRETKYFSMDTIRVALELFKQIGLIYEDADGCLVISEYDDMVGSETDYKQQKRIQRAKKNGTLEKITCDRLMLPNGHMQFVDEKRYGGNGMRAFELAGGECEMCGTQYDLLIHHGNGYSNKQEDLYVLCQKCHGKVHSESFDQSLLHHGGQWCGHVHTEKEIEKEKELDNINNNKCVFFDANNVQNEQNEHANEHIDAQNEHVNEQNEHRDTHFEQFWKRYPRKKEKQRARNAYMARLNDGWKPEELMQALDGYIEQIKKEHTEERFIKHGATFLSASTPFVDYLEKEEKANNGYITLTEEMLRDIAGE